MPSFGFLRSSRRDSHQASRNDESAASLEDGRDDMEKGRPERRQSKRDYLRGLLKRSSLRSESRGSSGLGDQVLTRTKSPEIPTSIPMSGPNKPLPPPPPPGSVQADPPSKPPKKLERIISPIAQKDLYKLFSGAPQFFARSEGHHTGAPHPSVAFPWNPELEIRDLTDHAQIHDEAWSCVTSWPHITLQVGKNGEAVEEHHKKHKARFLPRCRERPNMLSAQGLEKGTIGFQAALELGVADALASDDSASAAAISESRIAFLNGKDGLRPLTDPALIDRLINISDAYLQDSSSPPRGTVELYTELFTQILFPPSRVTDSDDPYSLQVQIEVLVEVLGAPLVWVDFSQVEWRIRVGQILWGTQDGMEADSEAGIDGEIAHEPATQKYWLLLQILLSCELLVRLDAVSMGIDQGVNSVTPAEIHRFDKNANPIVKWSLILARTWLENITIEKLTPDRIEDKAQKGWLASITGNTDRRPIPQDSVDSIRILGRNQARQISGLLHFGRKLSWPSMSTLTQKVSSNGIVITDSIQSTPIGTPKSLSAQRSSSYFSGRPGFRRGLSISSRTSTIMRPSGWLSNSYISGLILPGEALSHFLISTLLENDDEALSKLGEEANLYGGFIYGGKSFWSTSCIVGRILAARKETAQCMGWISSHVVPRGTAEGWVDVEVEEVQAEGTSDKKADKARVWHKSTVERCGHVIGGADADSVLPGDFILPSDESTQTPLTVNFESLDFFAAADSSTATPTKDTPTPLTDLSEPLGIKQYSAMMRFLVESDGEERKEVNLAITYDVNFVTAHPCVPSEHTKILSSPTLSSFSSRDQNKATGHPIHKSYTFTTLPILDLLRSPASTRISSLVSSAPFSGPSQSSTHTTSSTIPKVLIIDCTDSTMSQFPQQPAGSPNDEHPGHRHDFGSDLEMLGRAICAERGWNALVSRKGRACLACGVREAGALGWRVILRVA